MRYARSAWADANRVIRVIRPVRVIRPMRVVG